MARLIDHGMEEIGRLLSRTKIVLVPNHTNECKGKKHWLEVRKLPADSLVLANCTTSRRWVGSYEFIHIVEEIVVVQLYGGRRVFRLSCVRTFPSLLSMNSRTSDHIGSDKPYA